MRTTIDKAGRVVIPKAMRDELGLDGGGELEIELRDGRMEIAPVQTPVGIERRGGVTVLVCDGPGEPPVLTDEVVRETLEQVREHR